MHAHQHLLNLLFDVKVWEGMWGCYRTDTKLSGIVSADCHSNGVSHDKHWLVKGSRLSP